MKSKFLSSVAVLLMSHCMFSQNVGIGTSNPAAPFHVAADKTVLFGEDSSGSSMRFMWIPSKGALRAGQPQNATLWDYVNIGRFSTAMGYATATGDTSTAFGYSAASGNGATASGYNSLAIGSYSTAMGRSQAGGYIAAFRLGDYSTALGNSVTLGYTATAVGNSSASGPYAFAAGKASASGSYAAALSIGHASGEYALAMGRSTADADYSTAIGNLCYTNGAYSTAIGYQASTNGHQYSVCIGASHNGGSPVTVANEQDDEFMVYANHYRFWTNNSGANIEFTTNGSLNATGCINATNISCSSDERLKTDIAPLEFSMQKLMQLGTYQYYWKNETQSPQKQTGFIAQQMLQVYPDLVTQQENGFYAINYIGFIPVLTRGMQEQQAEISALKEENEQLRQRLAALEKAVFKK